MRLRNKKVAGVFFAALVFLAAGCGAGGDGTNSDASEELRPEFKEAMDTYEAFYDDYCEMMRQYKENPSDLNLLTKYTEMLEKINEMDQSFKEWDQAGMNNAEMQYYIDVNARVLGKLAEVTQ